MEELSTLEKLNQKVSEMLSNYDTLRMDNAQLKETLARVEAENVTKQNSIEQMQDDLLEKDMEIEEIVSKIESILG